MTSNVAKIENRLQVIVCSSREDSSHCPVIYMYDLIAGESFLKKDHKYEVSSVKGYKLNVYSGAFVLNLFQICLHMSLN